MVCYNVGNLNTIYEFDQTTTSNSVIGAYVDTTSNPVYNVTTTAISIYACAADVSGGNFSLGIWDSSGNLRVESEDFDSSVFATGSTVGAMQKFTKTIDSTTIHEHDTIGIINKTAITGSGDVSIGGWDHGSPIANWARSTFIQGSTPGLAQDRVMPICVGEDIPVTHTSRLPPPPLIARF